MFRCNKVWILPMFLLVLSSLQWKQIVSFLTHQNCRGKRAPTTPAPTAIEYSKTIRPTSIFSSYRQSKYCFVCILYSTWDDDNRQNDDDDYDFSRQNGKGFQEWMDDPRINIKNLLTQRSIQSFMFLCESVRDPHSIKWIEDFLQTKNSLEYHGTGATYCVKGCEVYDGSTWDGPLIAMMEQPKDVVVVSAKRRGRGHGGWSKHNPYLEERFVEFNIDIDPVSLVNRILSVREQIANEWMTDLDVLESANRRILESYFQYAKQERNKRDYELQATPTVAFERTAVDILNNFTEYEFTRGSPLRKGNFDLLYNLCTQASVHRVLRKLKHAGDVREVSYQWLSEFYIDRVANYFDGDQPYGRADDFMEELLLSSPSVIQRDDGKVALADPFGLAEQIIETRSDIVIEWKEAMQQVPREHQDGVRRLLLNKQMAAWGSSSTGLGSGSGSGSDGGFE